MDFNTLTVTELSQHQIPHTSCSKNITPFAPLHYLQEINKYKKMSHPHEMFQKLIKTRPFN